MTSFSLLIVDLSVASAAQGQQVFQCVIPQLLWSRCARAVNVVDVKIFGCSTVLASEVVAFQSLLPVASKVIVVACFAKVLRKSWVVCKRFPDLLVTSLLGAVLAVLLGTRAVDKIGTTICALDRAADLHGSPLGAEALQVQDVLLLPVGGTALGAALLHRASGLVKHLANDALAFLESTAGLTVSGQGARLASLEIGRRLGNLRSAVGALKDAVLPPLHNLNTTLSVL